MNEAFLNSDLLTRLRGYAEADLLADTCTEAADEIEKLRQLIKAFISAWERSELGENNGTEYFNAVHAMRMELRNNGY